MVLLRVVAALAASVLALGATSAQAATFVVDRLDEPPTAGACTPAPNDCSVEQAVNDANAKPDPDEVQIPVGEYAGASVGIEQPVTIVGAGADKTILKPSGAPGLYVNEPVAVEVRNLTITGAQGGGPAFGGGIMQWEGALKLKGVALVNNKTSGDPQYLTQHYIGAGGGIRSQGASLVIEDSLIANNSALSGATGTATLGGGITLFDATTVIRNSTISGNTAAAISTVNAQGGGIYLAAGKSLELENVTLAGNVATGGISGESGEKSEGGNIWIGALAKVKLHGSIIATGSAPIAPNCNAPLTTLRGNVEDRNECGLGVGDRANTDPLLSPLAANGGPTATRALGAASPAINLAGACGLPTDQRGVSRSDGACDAGAFEYVPPPIPPGRPTPIPAPVMTGVAQSHTVWREGTKLAVVSKHRPPIGTTFSFRLNEAAAVSLTFTQQVAGRSVKDKCVAPAAKYRQRHKCKRTVVRGVFTLTGKRGLNKVAFQGRISPKKKLSPGRYTLVISAKNTSGESPTAKPLKFTIAR